MLGVPLKLPSRSSSKSTHAAATGCLLHHMQYGEDQEVKTQELGDMYDPEGDE